MQPPQRIGEPIYVDEIGGMVLELVGACWRMPELAHTQATLSNTFAEVVKFDSDHAMEHALPMTARDRPVFGEVRSVIDEASSASPMCCHPTNDPPSYV